MNERIHKLMMDATKDMPQGFYVPSKYFEKFAKLIIQECLLALEPDPMAPAIDYDVEEKFYKRSANKIKNHFEVI